MATWEQLRMTSPGDIPPEVWNGLIDLVRAGLLESVVGGELTKRVGVGASLFIPSASGGSGIFPLDLSLTSAGETYTGTFRPGTVNGLFPSNIFELTGIDKTGLVYIKLDLTLSNAQVSTAVFSASGAAPTAMPVTMGTPPTTVSILTHVVLAGKVYRTIGYGNLWLTPAELFETDKTGAISPGEKPTDVWYSYTLDIVA